MCAIILFFRNKDLRYIFYVTQCVHDAEIHILVCLYLGNIYVDEYATSHA